MSMYLSFPLHFSALLLSRNVVRLLFACLLLSRCASRGLGIPSFQEKLLMTVAKLILEAIYEPTFSDMSHGFRPERSCHTALEQIKNEMYGVRWWVEGDIKGFFDNVSHDTLITILSKRITDKRFLH